MKAGNNCCKNKSESQVITNVEARNRLVPAGGRAVATPTYRRKYCTCRTAPARRRPSSYLEFISPLPRVLSAFNILHVACSDSLNYYFARIFSLLIVVRPRNATTDVPFPTVALAAPRGISRNCLGNLSISLNIDVS